MNNHMYLTIRNKFILAFLISMAVIVLQLALYLPEVIKDELMTREIENATSLAEMMAVSVSVALASNDLAVLRSSVQKLQNFGQILGIAFCADDGMVLATNGMYYAGLTHIENLNEGVWPKVSETHLEVMQVVNYDGQVMGALMLNYDLQSMNQAVSDIWRTALLVVGIAFVIGVIILTVISTSITLPVRRLVSATQSVISGDLTVSTKSSSRDEIGRLSNAFDFMVKAVQRKNEQLTASHKELESFSYTVSHDLKAPLRNVAGYVSILKEAVEQEPVDQRQVARYTATIHQKVAAMSAMIDHLLLFSRLGKVKLSKEPTDLSKMFRHVMEEFLLTEEDRSRVKFIAHQTPKVMCDPVLMRQVAQNLVGNALKFSKHRETAVIEFGADSTPDGVTYWLSDNGIGFDEKKAPEMFNVFQRIHGEEYDGHGVGLSFVQRIINRHNGEVWATLNSRGGALLKFTLRNG